MSPEATPVPAWHKLLFVVALIIAGLGYVRNIQNPIYDRHSFRQSQTATVIEGLAAGEDMAASKLYVFGPPWVMPVEFPLYQKLASLIVDAGVRTEVAGRLVAIAAFIGCLFVARSLLRAIGFPNVYPTLALIALFPTYQMWSRACLIESTALFLALASLGLFWSALHRPITALRFVCLIVMTSLAALQKLNAYLVVSVFAVLYALFNGRCKKWRYMLPLAGVWIFNIVALLVWGHLTDTARQGNELAERLNGLKHLLMLVGSVEDRLSVATYVNLVKHSLLCVALLPPIAWVVWRKGLHRTPAGAAVLGLMFAVAIVQAIFLKVYSVHDYYHYSTTIYIVIGLVFVTGHLLPARFLALGLVAACLGGAGFNELTYQHRLELSGTSSREPYVLISEALKGIGDDGIVLVLGDDWSSAVSFISGKKTWAIPTWAMADFLADPRRMAARCHIRRVAAVVILRDDYARKDDLIRTLYSGASVLPVVDFPNAEMCVVKQVLTFE